ncbi:hypothetical protein C0J52_05802 [Blattella germanica]|nr:hypothetical protein C0J52_05802 [Blattella germanica]
MMAKSADEVLDVIIKCTDFAALKHKNQRRKDPEKTPYINHPIGVARILTKEAGIRDIEVIQAALLHDTVEDTDTSFDEIEAEFGSGVCKLVKEVTDDKTLPKAERKRLQKRAPNFSEYEADIITELASKYISIVENKKTDTANLKKKEAIWRVIEKEFNAIEGVTPRSVRNLKTYYENIKRKTRRCCAAEEKAKGDSSSPKPKLSKTCEKILALIQPSVTHDPDTSNVDQSLQEEDINIQVDTEMVESFVKEEIDTSDTTQTSPLASVTSSSSSVTVTETPMSSTAPDLQPTEADPSVSLNSEREMIRLANVMATNEKIKGFSRDLFKAKNNLPNLPKSSSPKDKIVDFCEGRKFALNIQTEIMQREHEMDMIIKDLKIKILKEKLKYWQRMNLSYEEE